MTGGLEVVAPELLLLPAFALAAGVDLYLTLLFLGVAPSLGWWPELPGALGDLGSAGVLIIVGSFYVAEFLAERAATPALIWNAFHAIIRPLSGGLVAMLVLDGQPAGVLLGGAAVAGLLAAGAHATATGNSTLLWLGGRIGPNPLLVSVLEDVAVVGLVVLALDHPIASLVVSASLLVVTLRAAPARVRAFIFAVQMALGRAWRAVGRARWRDPSEFPGWVSDALADHVVGGGLRGSPAAAMRLPSAPRFTTGWVVVRGDTPAFLYARGRRSVDLGRYRASGVTESGFYHRVDLTAGDGQAFLFFGVDGPSRESLRAEFLGSSIP